MKRFEIEIRQLSLGMAIVCLLLSGSIVFAQEEDADDPAESTIRLMGIAEAELPEAVTKEIMLPPAAIENSTAVEKAKRGSQTAQENRERRETGLSRADEAREHGAEMAEEARKNRENRGRFEDPPGPPDDRPGPPDNPGPPDRPNGPPGS